MDAFIGTWKIIKKVNLDEYLKAIGIDEVSNDVKLTETVSKEGDYVVWKIMNSHHARDMNFILDKVFYDGTLQGRQCFSTINLNGNQLVQVRKWGRNESTIIREVKGNNMIMTLKFGDVEAQRIYEKV
ncbi:hypothetical protein KOW79_000405 [Hemibagrus wyckioides]|uniref:Cytosolic fatty-acid binding proteins domain-containing protein n=1 Tax=Hemibagrus wyckioides TaxID=337641 RepID=A0A9D3P6Y0_9TELE|nr:fatty acid-binding protein, brain-like [Hemibagrus wyckioides]KAG7335712.1 hypothetical protein KOW79_000405 [Hemibagrus wyckioides]